MTMIASRRKSKLEKQAYNKLQEKFKAREKIMKMFSDTEFEEFKREKEMFEAV